MKRDMSSIRHEVDSVHQCKEDIEELRDTIDKLHEQNRRRKMRLLEQVCPINAAFHYFTCQFQSSNDDFFYLVIAFMRFILWFSHFDSARFF